MNDDLNTHTYSGEASGVSNEAAARRGGDESFLGAVARACADRFEDMSDICFLFPNKRSSAFFLKNLSESIGDRVILAPVVADITSFMAMVSARETAPRIDTLFRLYNVYCGLLGRTENLRTEEDLLEFDRFAPWGETLVGDFNEVDKYGVDAGALFKNVRDYRSIASNFLTEEQLEVIERYFGYRPAAADVEGFWKAVGSPEDYTRLKEKFVELWKLMPELYAGLTADLEADGLAMPGATFRIARDRVRESGRGALPWAKVMVVGFNMLSTTEAELFAMMRDMKDDDGDPYAEFFWDSTGPVLGSGGKPGGPAVRAMRRNMRHFPSPGWAASRLAAAERRELPDITIAAAPSNAAQVKIAAATIGKWIGERSLAEVASPGTAIVIPDENLLMPLLHSLPESLKSVNLTMGYSMRYTSTASFIHHLRRLQSRRVKWGDRVGYLRDDIAVFLAHPLVHVLIGTNAANNINTAVGERHLRVVTPEWLESYSPTLADTLRGIPADAGVTEVAGYIDGVLRRLDEALAGRREELRQVNSKIERSQIAVYRVAMSGLLSSVRLHGIGMRWQSVFHLVDRLVAGEKVAFEGEPLAGLQVMGLLETRALDFDRLIILSMNDKVMPRRSRRRTFLPDALRRGYGMPVSSQGEELSAYYFYRLISRAREVSLIYDARAGEGMRSGGRSRFLMQLDLLHAPGRIRHDNYTFGLEAPESVARSVPKDNPATMSLLDEFRAEKGRNLSASALMNYCKCQVKFYYKNVVRLSDDPEAGDYIDAITQGNIAHQAMLRLYFPEEKRNRYLAGKERIVLTESDFDRMLADRERTARIVRRAVNREHFHLEGEELDRPLHGTVLIVAERLMSQIEDIMRHDRSLAPVALIGGEVGGTTRLRVGTAPEVNVRYAFDRVDEVAAPDGRGRMVRIIDYKTGSSHVEAAGPEDIFNGAFKAGYLLQLQLYANLLTERMKEEENVDVPSVGIHIYDLNTIGSEGSVMPKVGGEVITGHDRLQETFLPGLGRILSDIFDPSKPFEATADEGNCLYCAYRGLCGM